MKSGINQEITLNAPKLKAPGKKRTRLRNRDYFLRLMSIRVRVNRMISEEKK